MEIIDIYLEPSFILFSKEEIEDHPPLLLDMVEEVIIFYDRENFLEGELKKMKEKMKDFGSLRKKLPDGSWYWVLKPFSAQINAPLIALLKGTFHSRQISQ